MGLKIIDLEPLWDVRGLFVRSFCRDEYMLNHLEHNIVQCNISYNLRRGTLRGMHYQLPPHEEVKIIQCTQGSIFDVVVDLRKRSATYLKWKGFELRANEYRIVYVPRGCAHGYQSLEDNSTISYMVTESYYPEFERGVRWNDPTIKISWPLPVTVISKKDMNHPDIFP